MIYDSRFKDNRIPLLMASQQQKRYMNVKSYIDDIRLGYIRYPPSAPESVPESVPAPAPASEWATIGEFTVTENGAVALATTGSACLNFFSSVMARDKSTAMSDDNITLLLQESWKESRDLTLRLIAHLRDVRGGKGERHAAEVCWRWLLQNHPEQVTANAVNIPFYGRWSDLQDTFTGTAFMQEAMVILAKQLLQDREVLKELDATECPERSRKLLALISLAAKWAPTEDRHDDIRARSINRSVNSRQGYYLAVPSVLVATYLWENDGHGAVPGDLRGVMKNYRVNYLTPLRAAIGVVETLLCANKYDDIDFNKVPSVAMLRYTRKCFPRHMPERFQAWQKDVLLGKAKINMDGVDPYQVVDRLMGDKTIHEGEIATLEAFYLESIKSLRTKGTCGKTCVIADTSGSMRGTPMTVSVAMAIWISACANEEWRDLFYTFSTTPVEVSLKSCESLNERVRVVSKAHWGGTTNLLATFDLMLQKARANNYTADQMPTRLVIISDMQFNQACGPFTNLDTARQMYRVAGYPFPDIVFWNVRGNVSKGTGFPAHSAECGVVMISGFSKCMIDILLDNEPMPTAYELMVKTLMNKRYDRMVTVV
jgi:hypothetical protein